MLKQRHDIKSQTLASLRQHLQEAGYPDYAARQVFNWVYKKREESFFSMTNLSRSLRHYLKDNFYFSSLRLVKERQSRDGSVKFLFALEDKTYIESVLIPEGKRNTVCLSSQVGCRFGCRFCASGLLGFKRNLTPAEIVNQCLYVSDWLKRREAKLTNVVFMGIGEPFDNYGNVIKALRIILEPQGMYIGKRKVVISTCGLAPAIKAFAAENIGVGLSISLHAAKDSLRNIIMPVNKIYPLSELFSAVRLFNRRCKYSLTFEYIMISNFNISKEDVLRLKKVVKGLNYKINLIPYNPVSSFNWQPPSSGEIFRFCRWLKEEGVFFTLRRPRGQDIEGACGQLRLRQKQGKV